MELENELCEMVRNTVGGSSVGDGGVGGDLQLKGMVPEMGKVLLYSSMEGAGDDGVVSCRSIYRAGTKDGGGWDSQYYAWVDMYWN